MEKRLTCFAVSALISLASQGFAQQTTATFIPLGDLSGGSFASAARAISADGAVVVGESATASGAEAFRWTNPGGMVGLGTLYAGASSRALGASSDGSVIVGNTTLMGGASSVYPFIWTPAGGIVALGGFNGIAIARSVSGDGSVVVGTREDFGGFIWTQASGFQPSGINHTTAVSGDGLVVVGSEPATRCDAAGCSVLTPGAATAQSSALGVSFDGSVVVGGLSPSLGGAAFLWTQAAGAQLLDNQPPSTFQYSQASGVSGDGSVVVGERDYGVGVWPNGSSTEAFVWTSSAGMSATLPDSNSAIRRWISAV